MPQIRTAIGSSYSATTTQTLVESWNGSAWSIIPSPNPSGSVGSTFSGVSCLDSTACTAVGGTNTDTGAGQTLIEDGPAPSPPSFTSPPSAAFTEGKAGSFEITTTGTPIALVAALGQLPLGVSFSDNGDGTATLAGTPSSGAGGIYALTITASNGVLSNATQSFTLTVDQPSGFTSANSATFTKGVLGSFLVAVSGYPISTITESGTLPGGVTFTGGKLHGTPTVIGTFHLTFTAKNGVGPNAIQNFTLKVLGLHVVSTTLPSGKIGKPYSTTLTAIGGTSPYSWAAVSSGGRLPIGLHLIASGVLHGTPAQIGTFKFEVRVSEERRYGGQSATAVITLKIT